MNELKIQNKKIGPHFPAFVNLTHIYVFFFIINTYWSKIEQFFSATKKKDLNKRGFYFFHAGIFIYFVVFCVSFSIMFKIMMLEFFFLVYYFIQPPSSIFLLVFYNQLSSQFNFFFVDYLKKKGLPNSFIFSLFSVSLKERKNLLLFHHFPPFKKKSNLLFVKFNPSYK